MNKYHIPVLAVSGLVVLVVSAWVWHAVNAKRFTESMTNFSIPFGTKKVSERYESNTFGAEGLKLSVYELSPKYANRIYSKCEQYGYVRSSVQKIQWQFPPLEEHLRISPPVCVRELRHGVSVLQGSTLIVFIFF